MSGKPASLTESGQDIVKAVRSQCLGVVSSCVALLGLVRSGLEDSSHFQDRDKMRNRLQQFQGSIIRSTAKLANEVGLDTEERFSYI